MNVDTLLKNGDIALYRVKGWGRNTYSFYRIVFTEKLGLKPGPRRTAFSLNTIA
jgi:hypothetical protein